MKRGCDTAERRVPGHAAGSGRVRREPASPARANSARSPAGIALGEVEPRHGSGPSGTRRAVWGVDWGGGALRESSLTLERGLAPGKEQPEGIRPGDPVSIKRII